MQIYLLYPFFGLMLSWSQPFFHQFKTSFMAYSKAHLFDQRTYQQSLWSKATAHPARIRILVHLHRNGTTPFNLLAKSIPLARPTVSQHLRILREAGLISSYDKFPHTYYQLNDKVCRDLAKRSKPFTTIFSEADIP